MPKNRPIKQPHTITDAKPTPKQKDEQRLKESVKQPPQKWAWL